MGWKGSNEVLPIGVVVEAVQHSPEASSKMAPCPLPFRAMTRVPGIMVNGRPVIAVCIKPNCNTGFLGVEERKRFGQKRFRVTEPVRLIYGA